MSFFSKLFKTKTERKIEKIRKAVKKCYKEKAGGQVGGGRCDDCNSPLSKGKTYLIPGNKLWCESCTDKFLNADYIDWQQAFKDINRALGPGLPSYIQDMANKE